MPKMPCLSCGIPTQRSRCPACQDVWQASRPVRVRATPKQRGYDAAYQRMRLIILNRDHWTCTYCNKRLISGDATIDHVVPLSKGGNASDPSNLTSACRSCNSAKKDRV
jgi:5-methylcytosine-specific restriction endonuclease McrA